MEVVACDASSLRLYLEEGSAFGMLPSQLVLKGACLPPTALAMYREDSGELWGLWRVVGSLSSPENQVNSVHYSPCIPGGEEWCAMAISQCGFLRACSSADASWSSGMQVSCLGDSSVCLFLHPASTGN